MLTLLLAVFAAGCTPSQVLPAGDTPQLYLPSLEPDYRLQVGDVITIRSYADPELNQEVFVRPDGFASILLIDEIKVVGLTPAELDRLITQLYSPLVNTAEITVAVTKIARQQIFVGGQVARPAMMNLGGQMSLLQAITAAGGLLPTAKTNAVMLMRRDADGAVQTYRVNLAETLRRGQADPYLMRADVVFVPRTAGARASDWVDRNINGLIPEAVLIQFGYIKTDSDNPSIVVTPP